MRVHARLASRVVQDLHLTQLVFDLAGIETRADGEALFDMLDMIHAIRCPPRKASDD